LTWLVLACLLPGVIGAVALFVYEYRVARDQQQKDTIQTARALVQAVDNHLLRVQAIAQTLSRSDALLAGDFSRFHEVARETLALSGLSTNVVLRDEYGRQLLNTAVDYHMPVPATPAPEQVRGVFLSGRPTISDVFIGPVLKVPLISVDVPVVLNNEIVYALGIGILPSHFDALLKAQNLPRDWVAGVFDASGTIAGRSYSSAQYVGRKANARLLQAMTELSEGSVDVTTQEKLKVRSFFSRSPVTNWKVSIGIPRDQIRAELARTLSMFALGVAVLFSVGLAMARFMGGRIAASVQALTAPAAALGEGVALPVPDVHLKEASEVATAIGRAARLLQKRADELAEAHRLARFGTWHWDLLTGQVSISDSLREVYGRDVPAFPEMRGTVLPEESWLRIDEALKEVMRSGKGYDLEIQVIHASGARIWVNARGEAVLNANGEVVALRGMVQDITERKRAADLLRESEEKLRDAALHDSLTGLPNRALVMDFCERMLAAAKRGHGQGALLFIDLDRFKPINDLYGHEAGDRVLQEVGRRLSGCTREEDLVGRLGGDEFVIVLTHLDASRYRAGAVARHVVESISRPFQVDTLELSISPSIGISYFPEHASDVNALIHTADLAMYQAKQLGRANYQFYTSSTSGPRKPCNWSCASGRPSTTTGCNWSTSR
jgi:diguanylate cyclase (GGDEF)-like protein